MDFKDKITNIYTFLIFIATFAYIGFIYDGLEQLFILSAVLWLQVNLVNKDIRLFILTSSMIVLNFLNFNTTPFNLIITLFIIIELALSSKKQMIISTASQIGMTCFVYSLIIGKVSPQQLLAVCALTLLYLVINLKKLDSLGLLLLSMSGVLLLMVSGKIEFILGGLALLLIVVEAFTTREIKNNLSVFIIGLLSVVILQTVENGLSAEVLFAIPFLVFAFSKYRKNKEKLYNLPIYLLFLTYLCVGEIIK